MLVIVVVVDDDPGFRRIAATLLAARGMKVIAEAADGASAVEAVRRHHPDGVLLDLHLPDQNGLAVARTLRQEAAPPRVVLTSTCSSPWPDEELAAAGIHSFVPKDRLFDADLPALFNS